ncbi:MAG: cell division protein ZapA [Bacteroidetes bacterium]|nr:cell division protein ZapA [Bacteroidota bacterium]|tara:strand:+ start:399 stop:686 length:288 start_codon:yes stop_codon:yes gene_type:complete
MDTLTISVTIADRPYRLNIKKEEEEQIRKAAKNINERIKQYSENFAFNDKQDLLAMVSLEYANSSLVYKDSLSSSDQQMKEKLTQLDELLSENID